VKLVPTPIYNYIPESDIRMIMEGVSNLDTLEEACGKLIVNLMRELCQKDSDVMNNYRPTDWHSTTDSSSDVYNNFKLEEVFVHLANGRIRLTQVGREHCYEYH